MKKLRYCLLLISLFIIASNASAQTLEHLHLVCASRQGGINISSHGATRAYNGVPYLWSKTQELWVQLKDPFLGDSLRDTATFVSATGTIFDYLSNGWLTRSADGGLTFQLITAPRGDAFQISPIGDLFMLSNSWIARSTNEGLSWDSIPSSGLYVSRYFFDVAGNLLNFGVDRAIWRLSRSRSTWDSIGERKIGFIPNRFASLPKSSLMLISGSTTDSLYLFDENSGNWEGIVLRASMQGLCCDSSGHIYASIGSSFMRSDDTGHTWDSLGTSAVHWMAFESPSIIWCSTITHTIQFREASNSFLASDTPFEELPIVTIATSGDTVFAASQDDSAVFRSTNNGDSWSQAYRDSGYYVVGNSSLQISPDGAKYLTDNNALYRSYDGLSWTGILQFAGADYAVPAVDSSAELYLRPLGSSSNDGGTWQSFLVPEFPAITSQNYICYALDSFFYFSKNHGETWDTSDVKDSFARGVAIPHSQFGRIWLPYDSVLMLSIDSGKTWFRAMDGLRETPHRAITTDSYGHTFCIQGKFDYWIPRTCSIYEWTTTNQAWRQLTQDTSLSVYSLCANSNYLFLGTQSGVFRVAISDFNLGVTQEHSPAPETAESYPDPAAKNFSVGFNLNQAASVTIVAYDALGRTVLSMNAGDRTAGWNSVPITQDLPPGTYTYDVIAGAQRLRGRVAIVTR